MNPAWGCGCVCAAAVRFRLRCLRQRHTVIPITAANTRHPAPAAIPAIAPTASPLCGAGAGDADVVDGGLKEESEVEDRGVVDREVVDESESSEVVVADGIL